MLNTPSLDFPPSRLEADTTPICSKPIGWDDYRVESLREWQALLDSNPEEGAVQRFLELHPSFVPGGNGNIGPGGHHGSDFNVLFSQPLLEGEGRSFRPDFMWVTRSSGLITPILIEIEKPSKRWFNSSGRPSADFKNAQDQLNDWRTWFTYPNNQTAFRSTFQIQGDRFPDRPLEPQYLLIYGRRAEFEPGGPHSDPHTLLRKRDSQRASNEEFRSFDSLRPVQELDDAITAKRTAGGIKLHAFSPRFGTYPELSDGGLRLGDPSDALRRSVMMTAERKAYLAARWAYWMEIARERERNPNRMYFSTLKSE